MKIHDFKFWQVLALISGVIIAIAMALASVSYNATLGTSEPAFNVVPISNQIVFSSLALAFDLGMVASVFGFWHWLRRNRLAAAICALLFVIASLFSIHSVRGYIALNVTKSLAPAQRDGEVYASVKRELDNAQADLVSLRASRLKARGRARHRLDAEIVHQRKLIHETQDRLASTKPIAKVSPVAGLEWLMAIALWIFNATCWTAWFGPNQRVQSASTLRELGARARDHLVVDDSTSHWLATCRQTEPEHCARLYDRYKIWCDQRGLDVLPTQKFYRRLAELGARKFRDGRNGPMLYQLPKRLLLPAKAGAGR